MSSSIRRDAGNGTTVNVVVMDPGSALKNMPNGRVHSNVETVC